MATPLYNLLDENGLLTATRQEIIDWLTAQYEAIYGSDIDLTSSSPDGQMMNLFVQVVIDIQDLITNVYNGFDPDTAIGVVLDQRVAINGIQRQAGTYTTTNLTIVTSQALTLYGLDQTAQPVFTVADTSGNEWELVATQYPGGAGTYQYAFQAANPGMTLTVPNTITVPVTIVLGVTSVNNPTTYTTLGIDEETDAALKIRRQKSVHSKSGGFYNALYSALANVTGVTSVYLHENYTDVEDAYGCPGHTIWPIVAGNGADADIAAAIYSNRSMGCGMKGEQTYVITQADGSEFTVSWDLVSSETLYIKFVATSIDGVNAPDLSAIIAGLSAEFVPGVAEKVDVNSLATAVQAIDPNCLVTGAGFCKTVGGSYTTTLEPTNKNLQFVVQSQNIYITPVVLLPLTPTVVNGEDQQFTPYGGSQAGWVYWISVNNSGGSIDANGLYTAGATLGVDTIAARDSDANTAYATVTVI
jgi:uncharacterized phage protein gp47/JayE